MTGLERFQDAFLKPELIARYWPDILSGVALTLQIAVAVMITGLALGLALAVVRSYRSRLANAPIIVFVDMFRALPPLVAILIVYFGLPNIGIQGVCFGNTLAAISPKPEHFNWGMVVWHEVGHVFAIQLSKSHVPRWFTEGLSEWETIIRRPEWQREEDTALYLALREKRIPTVELMNRAFTHASDISDMTVAYYASSQIAVFGSCGSASHAVTLRDAMVEPADCSSAVAPRTCRSPLRRLKVGTRGYGRVAAVPAGSKASSANELARVK